MPDSRFRVLPHGRQPVEASPCGQNRGPTKVGLCRWESPYYPHFSPIGHQQLGQGVRDDASVAVPKRAIVPKWNVDKLVTNIQASHPAEDVHTGSWSRPEM